MGLFTLAGGALLRRRVLALGGGGRTALGVMNELQGDTSIHVQGEVAAVGAWRMLARALASCAARRHVSNRSPMSPQSCGTRSPHKGGEVALPLSIAMAVVRND